MKSTGQSHNRKYHNRPRAHAKKQLNNEYLKDWYPLNKQFIIRRDGKIGRVYDLSNPIDLNDPVKWNALDDGRLYITHQSKKLYAHHLVWLLVHGEMPKKIIFRDGDRSNVDPDNLIAPQTTIKRSYQARVRVGDTIRCLGSYPTKEEAVEAQNAFKALVKMGLVE